MHVHAYHHISSSEVITTIIRSHQIHRKSSKIIHILNPTYTQIINPKQENNTQEWTPTTIGREKMKIANRKISISHHSDRRTGSTDLQIMLLHEITGREFGAVCSRGSREFGESGGVDTDTRLGAQDEDVPVQP